MSENDPITQWIAAVKEADAEAAEKLWQRYWRRVAGMARKILADGKKSAADEEDVAQSAFRSFLLRAREARFPRLEDRQDLWRLLVTITVRKAIKQKHKQVRQANTVADCSLLQYQLSRAPSHEFVVAARDEIERLLTLLDESTQRIVAKLLEGCTNEEAASACGVSVATVERKRKLVRETWRREMEP